MQPARFRAYAAEGDVDNPVHNPAQEGDLEGGAAKFKADGEVAYVAFYGGDIDAEVCLGRVDGPFGPGKVAVSLPDPAE